MDLHTLTTIINAYIHRNGRQEITGDILNGVLLKMAEYSQDPDESITHLQGAVVENKALIEQEAQTARGYENQLYIKTSQEEERAKSAEARLGWRIDGEINRASVAEGDLANLIGNEERRAQGAEFDLSARIDAIVQGRNVRDIVANYAELQAYDTSTLGDNDIIMVLLDNTKSDHTTYYRWKLAERSWEFIGGLAFTYTKTEIDEKFAALHIVLPTFDEHSSQEVLAQVDEIIRHAGADASFKVAIPIEDMQGNVTVTYVKTNPMHTYIGVFADDRSELYHITRTIATPRTYTCEVITKVFATADALASLIKDLYNADPAEGEEKGDIVKLREGQEALAERIEDIERGETPNVSVFGSPRFDHGQVSGFSRENYLAMPFLFNVQNQRFELTLVFVMGADVNTPQNILGSDFSLAMYVQNGKLNVRVSSNGTDWNIISWEYSDKTLVANHPYFVSLAFDGINYAVKFSENGKDYTTIYNKGANQFPFARLLYLGIGNNFNNPFLGTINLNKCLLTIAGETFWEGMTAGGVPEAPEDGNTYGRKDGSWVEAASQAELSELKGSIYADDFATFEEGYFLDRTSKATTASASYRISDYIEVKGGQSVIYSGVRLGAAAAIIGYVAKDNTASAIILLGDTPAEQDFVGEVVIIPEGINYIRACGRLTTSGGAERSTSLHTKSLLLATKEEFGQKVEEINDVIEELTQEVAELDEVKDKMDIIAPTKLEDVTLTINSDKFTFVGNKIIASDGSFTDNASYYLYIYTFNTAGVFYMSTLGSSSYGFFSVYRGTPSASTFDAAIGRQQGSTPSAWGRIEMNAGDSVAISVNDARYTRHFTTFYETTLIETPALFRYGRKIAWFGDSISELKKLPHRTADNMSCEVYDCSQAGSSAVNLGTNPNFDGTSFQSICEQIAVGDFTTLRDTIEMQYEAGIIDAARKTAKLANVANLEAVNFNTINDIVVFIGTNDLSQSSMTIASFKSGLSTALSTLLNAYKNLNVYYILPAWRTDADEARPNGLKLSDICDAIIEVCHTYHIPYYDFYNACMVNPVNASYWLADGLHQTDAADIIWAEKLAKWLQSI